MKKIKRVYVAGAYSSDNVMGVFNNMKKGLRMSVEIALLGFYPFAPWLDYLFTLISREGEELTLDWYYNYSLDFLSVCDAMFVLPNFENSKGTLREIEFAQKHRIPIFYDLEKLSQYSPKFIKREK